jgi:hypothetical protein
MPIGAPIALIVFLLRQRKLPSTIAILRASGTGALAAMALLALTTEIRMFGCKDIEWRDRSWRLLGNRGQRETDDWTIAGVLGGVGSAASLGISREGKRAGAAGLGFRGWLGAAGLGGFAGVVGYFAWRYGLWGGKRQQDEVRAR